MTSGKRRPGTTTLRAPLTPPTALVSPTPGLVISVPHFRRIEKEKLDREQERRRQDQAREVAAMRAKAMKAGGAAQPTPAAKADDSSSVSSDSEDERDPCKVNLKKLKEKLSNNTKQGAGNKAMKVGRHWSEKSREEMDERDWRIFREDHQIATKGGKIPLPMRGWRDPPDLLPEDLLDVIDRVGYKKPSPIQMQCIPIGIQNRDCVGLAETGSGKTVAYLFPMLVYIKSLPPLTEETKQLGPLGLVLAPTRELVQQIEDECDKFMRDMRLNVYSIVGGISIEQQSFIAQQGTEVIIATPGRCPPTQSPQPPKRTSPLAYS